VHIELTVASGDREQDVAIDAPSDATVAALLPGLARAVGADPGLPLWAATGGLAPTSTLGESGLRIGSLVHLGPAHDRRPPPAVLSLHVAGGPGAGLVVPLERGRLVIGRAPECDLVLPDADVSRRHAVLDVAATAITLSDLGSTNGTLHDGEPVPPGGTTVRVGSFIAIGESLLSVAGPIDAPAAAQPGDDGTLLVQRPPRRQVVVPDHEIVLPTCGAGARPRGVQWVAALLPAAAGGAMAWLAHTPQFLFFALLSPLMMISTSLGDRLHWRRSRRRDAASFRTRRAEAAARIAAGLAIEVAARRASAPDPAGVLRQATLAGSRVWERGRTDSDLLVLRLGTADLPSSLRTRAGTTSASAGTVAAAPVCVNLRDGPLGVAGPPHVIHALARWLVGQVAALHSPLDVELALLLDQERAEEWAWARWLPHLRRVATSEDAHAALVADLAAIVDQRIADHRSGHGSWRGPWLVLVLDQVGRLAELPGLAALLERGSAVGLTAVCVDPESTALPTACASVACVHGVTGTRLLLRQAEAVERGAVIDQVSMAWAADLARGLAPLVDIGVAGASAMPDDCRLVDLLGASALDPAVVADHWSRAAGGARAVLGVAGDGPLEIDLAVDGPHALVAGTTGAGKSELLRTLVAGLAVHHPPDELNLLLVDYKGGAAFADCARLPHTAGLLTDLDSYLTERALRALNSELRRRERRFAEVGASDLTAYRAAGTHEPIPRLVVVVDEFASLADELPDFLRGLVGVAQRGRSLGIHLVLATQRPGGAVSAEIRANTSLRVALRVTDPGESSDIIGAPIAASIERSRPGRAYLRSGSTLTYFQVAHGSERHAPTDRDRISVEPLDAWRRMARRGDAAEAATDLARLVDAVQQAAQCSGRSAARSPWLPPLPDSLPRTALAEARAGSIPLGWIDLPDEQRRATLALDVGAGSSLLIAGTSRSGRTTAQVSLAIGAASQLAPSELHLHVVDATGPLTAAVGSLPHCATLLGPQDLALVPRLLRQLQRESVHRFAEQPGCDGLPRLLLLVDGWDSVCAALSEIDAAACVEALIGLLRTGPAAGLSTVVTGDRSVLAPRLAAGFADRVLLRLPDRSDYAMAGIATTDVPGVLPPGRGVRAADRAVVQLAHAGSAPGPEAAQRSVAAAAARWTAAGTGLGPGALRIRPLPTRIRLADLPAAAGRLTIGLAGDRPDPVIIDPFAGADRLLVAGPPRSGRTTLLRLLARQARAAGLRTLVAATPRSLLAHDARQLAVPVIEPSDRDVGLAASTPTLLLVDDSEAFTDTVAGNLLTSWVRARDAPLAVVAAGRADDLATTYRGIAAEVRRSQSGILLRPGPVDGELLGVRLPRHPATGPPGRGIAVGDPGWGPLFEDGEPVPIQVALP
jgi:S-DNA-T family DNA segregation ATPase FtsK/SpoIIIE